MPTRPSACPPVFKPAVGRTTRGELCPNRTAPAWGGQPALGVVLKQRGPKRPSACPDQTPAVGRATRGGVARTVQHQRGLGNPRWGVRRNRAGDRNERILKFVTNLHAKYCKVHKSTDINDSALLQSIVYPSPLNRVFEVQLRIRDFAACM